MARICIAHLWRPKATDRPLRRLARKAEKLEALMFLSLDRVYYIYPQRLFCFITKKLSPFFLVDQVRICYFFAFLCHNMSFAPILLPGPPSPFFLLLQPPTFRLLYLSPNLLEYVTQLGFVDWKEKTLGNLLHPNDLAQTMNDSLAFLKNGTVNGCTTKCLLNWTPVR